MLPTEPAGIASVAHQPRDDDWFPEEKPLIVERLEMGAAQYRQYLAARERENAEFSTSGGMRPRAAAALSLPTSARGNASTYYVRSRMASNFLHPGTIDSSIKYLDTASPKMALIAQRATELDGIDLVYSQFVSYGGLRALAGYLRARGMQPYVGDVASPGEAPCYAIIAGDVSIKMRQQIVAAVNAPNNTHGKLIKVILVSKTGAEGLDLKCVRRTHQLEPYWDEARNDQVRARAVRFGSHNALPRAERDVQPYLYVAVANATLWKQIPELSRETETIDEMFYVRAHVKYLLNNEFRQLLREVSLECSLFGYGNCRTCVASGVPLRRGTCAVDVGLRDPCTQHVDRMVRARTITVRGRTYRYTLEPLVFYQHDPRVDGYVALQRDDPTTTELATALAAEQAAGKSK
jgi:hypothetical protein